VYAKIVQMKFAFIQAKVSVNDKSYVTSVLPFYRSVASSMVSHPIGLL